MLKPLISWFLACSLGLTVPAPGWAAQAATTTSANASRTQQNTGSKPEQDQSQNQSIPDAPSAVQPPPAPMPNLPATPGSEQQPQAPAQQPPPNQPPPRESSTGGPPAGPPPPFKVRTVPEGAAARSGSDSADHLIKVNVNQVIVPVAVRDEDGKLVPGLLANDFSVRENGKKQKLNFFTSDPFAISAAVIFDLGMKDVDVQKVNHTLTALEGAFSQFDEISIYSYSNAVGQLSNWTAVGQRLSDALATLANARGTNNGPPIVDGPIGPRGPIVNNQPVDPNQGVVAAPAQQSRVLNDAMLRAALDLAKRPRDRRKVIFIISDGREYRSNASYRDVLRVLLSNNIMVYGIGVGGSAIPGYNKISRLHLPRFGYSDILPKYASATGGDISNELTRTGIEDAYARLLGAARNQYTLGYITHEPLVGQYNEIEVVVERPSCRRSSIRPCVDVTSKAGYYAMPPARQ